MVKWYFKLIVVAILFGGAWFFQQEIAAAIGAFVKRAVIDVLWLWLVVFVFLFYKFGSNKI